jgi:MarR family transcriptional regulator for hemolysin
MAVAVTGPEPAEIPPAAPVENLGWLLSQASYVLQTQMTAALEGLGITPRSYCLLATAMTGEFTQTELAQAVGMDKTTMVVTMDELEAAGLAERRPSAKDRRARCIAVTKAGMRKVEEAEAVVDAIHEDVLASLPAKERRAFVDGLRHLVGDRLASAAACSKPPRRRAPR